MSDEMLRRALSHRRFAGPPRLLCLDSGYHVIGELVQAARALGWEVHALPTAIRGTGDERFLIALLTALAQRQPDFLLTVNHLGFDTQGVLAGLLARYGVPLASWFVDHPLPILGPGSGNVSPFTQVFCVERTALPWLAAEGFRDPTYLPTAAATACHPASIAARLQAAPQLRGLAAPLCLVGDSWWRKAWAEPPHLVEAARRLRAERPLDRALISAGLPGVPLGDGGHAVVQVALAQEACEARRALGQRLTPLGLRVFGDPHWADLVPGLDLRPFAHPTDEAPAIFAQSEVNVNVTAPHLPSGVNQRVWDVPGAGGFLLTDAQEDVLACFAEGTEAAVYRDLDEAADKARHYLAHPAEREAIARRAHAKIERAHRYPHRLLQIYQTMRSRFA